MILQELKTETFPQELSTLTGPQTTVRFEGIGSNRLIVSLLMIAASVKLL